MGNDDGTVNSNPSNSNSKVNTDIKTENSNNNVDMVSVRLPNFWTTSPYTWFVQAEAQFNLNKIISDRIKYYMVVASLSQEVIESILDVVQNPPEKDKYQNLKTVR